MPTKEEIRAAIDDVFLDYPGARIAMAAMSSLVVRKLTLDSTSYSHHVDAWRAAQVQVEDCIREEIKTGRLISLKGRSGGICRPNATEQHQSYGAVMHSNKHDDDCACGVAKNSCGHHNNTSAPKPLTAISHGTLPPPAEVVSVTVNDHTCPGCGNNRCSKSEKTCWRCGGAL